MSNETVELTPNGLVLYKDDKPTEIDPDWVFNLLEKDCNIAEGTTLGDIFDTVEKYPLLKIFFTQYSSCNVEAFHKQAKEQPFIKDGALDYLEIYHGTDFWTEDIFIYPGFHGIRENGKDYISVSYSPMYELVGCPVKLNTKFEIYKIPEKAARVIANKSFTLQEVLHAIYWDISFMGSPEDNAKFLAETRQTTENIKKVFFNEL